MARSSRSRSRSPKRKANKYALFVKKNYKKAKASLQKKGKKASFSAVAKKLSAMWAKKSHKHSPKQSGGKRRSRRHSKRQSGGKRRSHRKSRRHSRRKSSLFM